MKINLSRKTVYYLIAAAVALFFAVSPRTHTLIKRKFVQMKLSREIKELRFENDKLKREIYRLENDDSYIEYLIRRDLGYLKDGELEYRFKPESNKK